MATKEEKVAFVSGLSGTSIWEVYGVIFTSAFGLIVRHVGILCSDKIAGLHLRSSAFAIFWEFVTVFFPAFLCFTILANHFYIVTITLLLIIMTSLAITAKSIPFKTFLDLPYPNKSPAVSTSRTWVNVFTFIAILAVDFNIFPRRFAKSETYGVGVMDVGVGCYMLCHGSIAHEARYELHFNSVLSYLKLILQSLRKVLPFIVIGLFRVTTVRATDYQLHVSEYGVHWNFFFTIAAVKVLAAITAPLPSLLPRFLRYLTVSGLILLIYQTLLSRFGLMEYIVTGPGGDFSRDSFISANREGIVSCMGYLGMYYLGVQLGKPIHSIRRKTVSNVSKFGVVMLLVAVFCVIVTVVMEVSVDKISRRAANVTYCCWIASVAIATLCIMLVGDLVVIYLMEVLNPSSPPSPYYAEIFKGNSSAPSHWSVMSAIDYNQFTVFLLANLGTGFVNFTVDTIHTGPVLSFVILTVYLLFLIVTAITLQFYQIKIA